MSQSPGSQPFVSVVVETVTPREDVSTGSLADDLAPALAGVAAQTYPRERMETIVVIDPEVAAEDAAEIARRFPWVRIVSAKKRSYFAGKNAGAAAARGEFIALLDGDCVPAGDNLATLMARFEPGIGVVAGETRYDGQTFTARTFSVPDFAYVLSEGGEASGILLNNIVFRREVLLAHPFDERIRRNGGCVLLYHQLRHAGVRVVYESRATTSHGLDIAGLGFVKKHFARGYDNVAVYRADDTGVLRGTRLFRRAGVLALGPIYARRLALDWVRLFRHRKQIGIPVLTLPWFGTVAAMLRAIELCGGLTAMAAPAPRVRERAAGA